MEVADFAEEDFVVDLVFLEDGAEALLELCVVVELFSLLGLDLLQQLLDGLL